MSIHTRAGLECGSAVVATETEWVADRIYEHPNVGLGLARREHGPEGKRLVNGFFEITDLKVKVQHRSLGTFEGRPDRRRIPHRLLEHEEGHTARCCNDRRARLFVSNRPAQQLGVEASQGSRVRCLNGSPPPHTVRARSHPPQSYSWLGDRIATVPGGLRALQTVLEVPVGGTPLERLFPVTERILFESRVEGLVELAVASSREAVHLSAARGDLDGGGAVVGGELVARGEAGDVAGVADERAGEHRPDAEHLGERGLRGPHRDLDPLVGQWDAFSCPSSRRMSSKSSTAS